MQANLPSKEERRRADIEIVQSLKQGDPNAFEQLMRRYNRPLYRAARSILKNDVDAEDAVQEAYFSAFKNIESFRGEAELSTWLMRIVINEANGRLRTDARRAQILQFRHDPDWERLMDADEHSSELPSEFAPQPSAELPDRTLERNQMRQLIEKKIDILPEAFRTVFMLRALEEMSVEETAVCLDIPEATVRSRYFRAKSLLRESLSREIDYALEDAFSFDGERCDRIVFAVLAGLKDEPGSAPK